MRILLPYIPLTKEQSEIVKKYYRLLSKHGGKLAILSQLTTPDNNFRFVIIPYYKARKIRKTILSKPSGKIRRRDFQARQKSILQYLEDKP